METLENKIKKLPPEFRKEVEDFVEELLEKSMKTQTGNLRLTWRGGLKELRNQYTSVELQHKSLEWWNE